MKAADDRMKHAREEETDDRREIKTNSGEKVTDTQTDGKTKVRDRD